VFNDRQKEKDSSQRISTDFGISITSNLDLENAFDSIRRNLDPVSKLIIFNELHSEKHSTHKISIELGISTSLKQPKYPINSFTF
jgi:predicted transcriptional regulator